MRTILAKVFLACGVWLLGGNAASAATTQFKVASGDWSNAANWSGGLPTPPNEAEVGSAAASPATAAINPGDALTSGALYIGRYAGQVGAVNQSGGSLNLLTNYFRVGSAGAGTYNLSGGTVSNATLYVATGGGTGTVHISSGIFCGNGRTAESATVGRSANSFGHVVQTGGLFSLNDSTNTADFVIGRDYGVGLYELSGGVVTNVKSLYLGMAATAGSHPLGTLVLSGSGALYASKDMCLGYGGTATGIVSQSGGIFSPTRLLVGTSASGSRGVGRYEISGGKFVGALEVGSGGNGTLQISGDALLETRWFNVGAAGSSTGLVYQTGGCVDTRANAFGVGSQTGGFGRYMLMSGSITNLGALSIGSSGGSGFISVGGTSVVSMTTLNSWAHPFTVAGSSSSKGTLQIAGANVKFKNTQDFTSNQAGSTLDYLFRSEGISPLTVGWSAYLGGKLSMGLDGGVAVFATNAFTFLTASSISGDFATRDTGVFTVAMDAVKKRYAATLDESQKVSATPLSRGGQGVSFAPVAKGWLSTSVSDRLGPTFDLALEVTTTGATPVGELDDLVAYLGQSGFAAKRIAGSGWSGPNVVLTLPASTSGATRHLAWDLSRFDAALRVAAATVVDKNAGTVIAVR